MGKVANAKTKKDPGFKPASIQEHIMFSRAVEAVIWGMPAVNFELLWQATIQAKSAGNEIIYWSHLPSWKNQTLTPNPDIIYFIPFFDTRQEGPRSANTPGLQKNADGSIDIYFGPQAPAGKESNWIPTNPQCQFEVLFRFYGPEPALFNKTWKLPDIEKV